MRYILLTSSILLAGCAAKPIIVPVPKEVPHDVVLTVATGCIAKEGRPHPVKSLDQLYTAAQWKALAPGARAAAIHAQSLRRLNFEDVDGAATSACK